MPQKKTRRDYPLSPTPKPIASDNTRVKIAPIDVTEVKKPKFTNVEADIAVFRGGKPYSKEDSLDYKKGFDVGYNRKQRLRGTDSTPFQAGRWEGEETPKPKKKFLSKP